MGCHLLILLIYHALSFQSISLGQTLDEEKAIKVKAAYLYSFSKFVTWPETKFPTNDQPITLGILSSDASKMKELLDTVVGKRGLIQNRRLRIISLDYISPSARDNTQPSRDRRDFVRTVRNCHMLFVDHSSQRMRQDLFEVIHNHKVLSVGSGDKFVREGGMVALVRQGESIVFQVNIASVNREGLTISPKLLRNAILIR